MLRVPTRTRPHQPVPTFSSPWIISLPALSNKLTLVQPRQFPANDVDGVFIVPAVTRVLAAIAVCAWINAIMDFKVNT